MAEELLKIEKLAVFHGSFQALWDVSLVVRSREIVALIGASSAGNSTLLDTISGFINPSKGKIKFQGEDITALDPYRVVDLGITQVPRVEESSPN